ncbi:unnamed protein product [Didymodactylos carnosus]|uniref:Fe-S cluster assembly protein SufB n=1 Tax=Didymodactylos carnosus TaxID=1234261 RepID=A0A8S2GYY4_9BILA|nr:unnamed protein product [Didymodactylos carnosus]CAF3581171.1 unnamed protein product [Didymodactylos carnosus]
MAERRLEAYAAFKDMDQPAFGPDLSFVDFSQYRYYVRPAKNQTDDWQQVPTKIRETFARLGIPEAEAKFLHGVTTQYDSEVVYHSMLKEVSDKGVIFTDMDSAIKLYPELVQKYFGTLVAFNDNKYASLNAAVWSGGSFVYVPPFVKVDLPLQAYFRINRIGSGQFERTLIIVDEGAELHYIEGCTAPIYSRDNLHAAVVEVFVGAKAKCRYTTIQN